MSNMRKLMMIAESYDQITEDHGYNYEANEKDFELATNMCPDCEGTGNYGHMSQDSAFPGLGDNCPRCDGAGEVFEDENDARGKMCPVCSGQRREGYGNDCPNCNGEGYVTEEYDEEDDEHYDKKNAEVEKFKGRKILVTDIYDGDVYGYLGHYRFIISSPIDRGYGVGDVSDDEIQISDLDFGLTGRDEDFLRAWHRSYIDEGSDKPYATMNDGPDKYLFRKDQKQKLVGSADNEPEDGEEELEETEGDYWGVADGISVKELKGAEFPRIGYKGARRFELTGLEQLSHQDRDHQVTRQLKNIMGSDYTRWQFEGDPRGPSAIVRVPIQENKMDREIREMQIHDRDGPEIDEDDMNTHVGREFASSEFGGEGGNTHVGREFTSSEIEEGPDSDDPSAIECPNCKDLAFSKVGTVIGGDDEFECENCGHYGTFHGLDEGPNNNWGVGDNVITAWDEPGEYTEPLKVISVRGDKVKVVDDYGNVELMSPNDLRLAPNDGLTEGPDSDDPSAMECPNCKDLAFVNLSGREDGYSEFKDDEFECENCGHYGIFHSLDEGKLPDALKAHQFGAKDDDADDKVDDKDKEEVDEDVINWMKRFDRLSTPVVEDCDESEDAEKNDDGDCSPFTHADENVEMVREDDFEPLVDDAEYAKIKDIMAKNGHKPHSMGVNIKGQLQVKDDLSPGNPVYTFDEYTNLIDMDPGYAGPDMNEMEEDLLLAPQDKRGPEVDEDDYYDQEFARQDQRMAYTDRDDPMSEGPGANKDNGYSVKPNEWRPGHYDVFDPNGEFVGGHESKEGAQNQADELNGLYEQGPGDDEFAHDDDAMVDVGDMEYDDEEDFSDLASGDYYGDSQYYEAIEMNELRRRAGLEQITEHEWSPLRGNQTHPRKRIPIDQYDQFRQENPGAIVRFRGPRRGTAHTRKEDATHFYIVREMSQTIMFDEELVDNSRNQNYDDDVMYHINDERAYYLMQDILGAKLDFGPEDEIKVPRELDDMVVAELEKQGFEKGEAFWEAGQQYEADLQNGYDDRAFSKGSDYFPKGAQNQPSSDLGPSASGLADNPMSNKMRMVKKDDVYETMKLSYRRFRKS